MAELVEHAAWQSVDLKNLSVLPLSEEQWDVAIDLSQKA
jgi:hypothetical protein